MAEEVGERVTHVAARIRGHAWTRDGRALVFASDHDGPMSLHVVDIEGGVVSSLGILGEFPDTSRADDHVVFEIPRMQSALSRIALSADSPSSPDTLAPSTGDDFAPAVSPDGSRVVFVSDRSRQHQLWLHDLASGEVKGHVLNQFSMDEEGDYFLYVPD